MLKTREKKNYRKRPEEKKTENVEKDLKEDLFNIF